MSRHMLAAFLIALTLSTPLTAEVDTARLAAVLDAQPTEVKARYAFRHPQETLAFFGVAPGSVVVEALPGRAWYTRILAGYVGPAGQVIGVDYARDMFPLFGFFSEEQLEAKKTWAEDFVAGAAAWGIEDAAPVSAFVFGDMPDGLKGTADTVLFIRALHNLARFEQDGGYLTTALQNAFDLLKPGGVVGVVQHHARQEMPDEWAGGQNGYLKYEFVLAAMKQAGFEFIGAADINANENDQPTEQDRVWRLPPSLVTSREDPELRRQMVAIGESNRMTLKFRKPE